MGHITVRRTIDSKVYSQNGNSRDFMLRIKKLNVITGSEVTYTFVGGRL